MRKPPAARQSNEFTFQDYSNFSIENHAANTQLQLMGPDLRTKGGGSHGTCTAFVAHPSPLALSFSVPE